MAQVTFKATARKMDGGLSVESESRGFKFILDEPPSLGGTDAGMNPVEALLGALGACQTIVAFAFAKAHGIALEDFWIELEGDLDTDGFLKGKPGVRNGFSEVRLTTHIKSDASEEKAREFVEFIHSRCPVGDSMANLTQIVQGDIVLE
ncbi:MAG: OsmC family protein [Anaerolineaceae bacterium]|nr:OsmC family protein [Anaerolineaceae bacterium]